MMAKGNKVTTDVRWWYSSVSGEARERHGRAYNNLDGMLVVTSSRPTRRKETSIIDAIFV
jgi:hypothetical protein